MNLFSLSAPEHTARSSCRLLGLSLLLSSMLAVPVNAAEDNNSEVEVIRLHSFAHDALGAYGTYSGFAPSAPPVMGRDGYLYGTDTYGYSTLPWLQSVDHYTYKMLPVAGAYAGRNSVVYDHMYGGVFSASQGTTGPLVQRADGTFYGVLTGRLRYQNKVACDWQLDSPSGIFRLTPDYDPSERLPYTREMLTLPQEFRPAQVAMPADFVDTTFTKICPQPGELYWRTTFVAAGALTLNESDQMLYGYDDGPVKRLFQIDTADTVSELWRLPETIDGRRVRPASVYAHNDLLYVLLHLDELAGDATNPQSPAGVLYQVDPKALTDTLRTKILHKFVRDEGRIVQAQSELFRYWNHNNRGGRYMGDARIAAPHLVDVGRPDPVWEALASNTYIVYGEDGWLYGNARDGGDGFGSVWRIRPDGTEFTVLHKFQGTDGDSPIGPLAVAGNAVYGTTQYGGQYRCVAAGTTIPASTTEARDFHCSNEPYGITGERYAGFGTLFRIETDNSDNSGTVHTVMHSFNHAGGNPDDTSLADGSWPTGLTAGSDGKLYGTTKAGGHYNSYFVGDTRTYWNGTNGTIFQVDLNALAPKGSLVLTVAPADGVLDLGESATFSWSGSNISNCRASGGLPGQPWAGNRDTSGSEVITPHFPGLGNYVLACDDDLRPGSLVSAAVELRIIGQSDVLVEDDRLSQSGGALSLWVLFGLGFCRAVAAKRNRNSLLVSN